jgi:hypothetical protein
MRGRLIGTIIAVAVGLLPLASEAAPAQRDVAQAKRWFSHGVAAANAGEYDRARKDFVAAYALVPSVDILWNLSIAEEKVGMDVDALVHVREYVAHSAARPDKKRLGEERIAELEGRTARLEIVADDSATIFVDGAPSSGGTLDVAVGVHSIVVKSEGHDDVTRAVDAKVGQRTVVNVKASEIERQRPPVSSVALSSAPAPLLLVRPPTRASVPDASESHSNKNRVILGLGGAAVAALAAGVFFAWQASNERDEANRLYPQISRGDLSCPRAGSLCGNYDDARSAADRNQAISTGLLVTGGVVGGAAVAAWVLWPSSPVQITPSVGKEVAGAAMHGRF